MRANQRQVASILLNNKLYIAFLALIFYLPLPMGGNRPMMWASPVAISYLLLGIAMFELVRSRLNLTSAIYRARWVLTALLVVALWMLLQPFLPAGMHSEDAHATYQQLLKSGMYISIFSLCLLVIRTREQLELLLWVIVVAGVLQVLVKIIWNVSGSFVNKNHFAGYLEMSLALALGLMLARLEGQGNGGWRSSLRSWARVFLGPKILIRVLIVILVVGLILSRSRMGNIGFFVGLGLAGLVGVWTFKGISKTVVTFFVSILTIDVFLMGAFFGIDKLQQRFERLDETGGGRAFFNEHSLELLQSYWFTGAGGGSFYAVYPMVRDHRIPGFLEHAHNDYLELWIELGVFSFLLAFCAVHAMVISIKVQFVRRSRFMKAVGFASLMGITSLLVHSFSDFNLQLTSNAATFMVLLALPYLALTIDRRTTLL